MVDKGNLPMHQAHWIAILIPVSESMLCLPRFAWLHLEPSVVCSRTGLATTTTISSSVKSYKHWHDFHDTQ